MFLFLLLFLTVYGGLNTYVYFRISSGLGYYSWAVAVALVFLVLSPIVLRLTEGRIPNACSRLIAWVGFNWMGLSFLFFSIGLLVDLAQLFLHSLNQQAALIMVAALTVTLAVYGFIESRRIRIRFFKVESPKLEFENDKPLRVVQISDLHLGYGTFPCQIQNVVEKIQSLSPDLLVSTGDLVDTDLENLGSYIDQFKSVLPPLGKLAISGNHEVYAGLDRAVALTEASGFKVLRSEARRVSSHLYIAGVDDPEALAGRSTGEAELTMLGEIPETAFTILLKHRPHIASASLEKFDLQLSGHTHGGQIFPFIFLTRLQYKARHGLTKIAKDTYLYLSRGTGSWGPQMRLFAPPEITVFDLVKGESYFIEKNVPSR